MGMCEALGVMPSELLERYPNMTPADKSAWINYTHEKYGRLGDLISRLFDGTGRGWIGKGEN